MDDKELRKQLQAGTKELNKVLGLKPALKFIAPLDTLKEQVVTTIAGLVAGDGSWKDARASMLSEATIAVYNYLVAADTPTPAADTPTPEADTPTPEADTPTPPEEGKCDCPAYGVAYDSQADECQVCEQSEACRVTMEAATKPVAKRGKAKAKPAKPAKPAEPAERSRAPRMSKAARAIKIARAEAAPLYNTRMCRAVTALKTGGTKEELADRALRAGHTLNRDAQVFVQWAIDVVGMLGLLEEKPAGVYKMRQYTVVE